MSINFLLVSVTGRTRSEWLLFMLHKLIHYLRRLNNKDFVGRELWRYKKLITKLLHSYITVPYRRALDEYWLRHWLRRLVWTLPDKIAQFQGIRAAWQSQILFWFWICKILITERFSNIHFWDHWTVGGWFETSPEVVGCWSPFFVLHRQRTEPQRREDDSRLQRRSSDSWCGEIFAQLVAVTHLKHLFEALDSHFVSLKSPCKLHHNLDSVS